MAAVVVLTFIILGLLIFLTRPDPAGADANARC
jgi:hypothetical protein